jgi:hypothetical protein
MKSDDDDSSSSNSSSDDDGMLFNLFFLKTGFSVNNHV